MKVIPQTHLVHSINVRTEGAITNGQSRETGNTRVQKTKTNKTEKKPNTIFVGPFSVL